MPTHYNDSGVSIRGTGVVYAQEHQRVVLPDDLRATIKEEGATVLLTPVGHEGIRNPLTTSPLRDGVFTVYNHNESGVSFNWAILASRLD